MDDLMTLDDLCELGHLSKSGYRNLRSQGLTPPAFRVGRRLMFRRSDVEQWMRTVRVRPVA